MTADIMHPGFLLFVLLAGCGFVLPSNQQLQAGPCSQGDGLLYPLQQGAWWRHDVVEYKTDTAENYCKLVHIQGPPGPVTMREDQTAWEVHSFKVNSDGLQSHKVRWQEVRDCAVIRHVDESFTDEQGTVREKIVFFCPHRLRLPDCPGACDDQGWDARDCEYACEGGAWTERFRTGTLEAESGTPWSVCLEAVIHTSTCLPLFIPEGCTYEGPTVEVKYWSVDQVGVGISAEVPQGAQVDDSTTAFANAYLDDQGRTESWDTKCWTRGVGKVHEHHPEVETEILVDRCLPSEGCQDDPPDIEAMIAACAP
jgi:hypothetical protein